VIDLKAVQRVNNHPLNRAAGKWLPARLRNKDQINLLALAQWGLENGLEIKPPSPEQPTLDEVEQKLQMLARGQPLQALQFLQEVDGEKVLEPSELESQPDRKEAASLLLQTLYSNMVASRA
jgi:hypothetical protein